MIYVANEKLSATEALARLGLSKNSHILFKVSCDFTISEKCRREYSIQYRDFVKHTQNNNGKLPCLYCSRTMKFSGRNNPNTKYKEINDNFFSTIDSEKKAYFLGWIASDGTIGKRGFKIAIKQSDKIILKKLRDVIGSEAPLKTFRTPTSHLASFEINSQKIAHDLCRLLHIKPGKKSHSVRAPKLPIDLFWHFMRGYFDGDGTINDPAKTNKLVPVVAIRSSSAKMLQDFQNTIPITSYITKNHSISWENKHAYTFLECLYKNSSVWLPRKMKRYQKWKIKML